MQRKGKGNKYMLTYWPLCNAWIQKSEGKSNLRNKLFCVKQLSQNDNARGVISIAKRCWIRHKDQYLTDNNTYLKIIYNSTTIVHVL